MAHDVFISYAIEDQRVADAVCEALEKGGVRCWYAPRDVPYAVDYEEAIIDGISQSKLMLLILSEHANASAHVKREVQNACREEPQIPVLPFQIADVPLSKSFRYYLGSVQWLVASTPPLEAHLQKLVNYVQQRLPQSEQDRDSGAQSDQPAQEEIVEKDEEETLRLAEEVERRRVEEEKRLAAEAEAERKAEEERQLREAEEKLRAEEEEETQRRMAEEEATRLAAEERRREEEERERREAEERQRLEAEEAARLKEEEEARLKAEEEERLRVEAEANRKAEEEERRRVEAQQEAERLRLEEEKQARAEEERREQEAAEATRRAEEERQEREEAESRQREFVEVKQRLEEAARQEKERQAEERRASEARFRELNLGDKQKTLAESSTEIMAGDVSTPAYQNRRVVLIAAASLGLLVVAGVIWLTQRGGSSHSNINQSTATQLSTATQPAPVKVSPSPGDIVRNRIGMELVYIQPGEFTMGSENGDADEKPVHQVTIRKGFYVGKYEVTQAEWKAVMRDNPSTFKGDRLPVENVTWENAQNFIQKLNAMDGEFTYRLPTEAEWEYAARARTTTAHYWGDDVTEACRYGNVLDQTVRDKYPNDVVIECRDGYVDTALVGKFQPNTFGLYDTTGNVWEWCDDYYHESYKGAPTDGAAWLSGADAKYRVLRGGAANVSPVDLPATNRDYEWRAETYFINVGFRVVAVARQ